MYGTNKVSRDVERITGTIQERTSTGLTKFHNMGEREFNIERATDPVKIAEAEGILRKYCEKLSLESISIFKKDGLFMYSSDPTMTQPENVGELFEVLEYLSVDLDIGVIQTITLQDTSSCMVLIPVHTENMWGEIDGWYAFLGDRSNITCPDLSEHISNYEKMDTEQEIKQYLETSKIRAGTLILFDLPRILGRTFEKNDDTIVTLRTGEDCDYFLVHKYERTPGWLSDEIPADSLSELNDMYEKIAYLDECLRIKTKGILEPEPSLEKKTILPEKRPIPFNLLIFTLLYGILLMLIDQQTALITLGAIVLVLVVVATRKPSVTAWFVSIALIVGGILAIFVSIFEVVDYPNYVSISFEFVIFIPRGLFVLLLGNLFRILYGVKLHKDEPEH